MTENILLVNLPLSNVSTTPFFVMPMGLLSIASYLRSKGEQVDVIDLNVVKSRKNAQAFTPSLAADCVRLQPMLVGFSVMVAGQFKLAFELAQQVKAVLPQTVIVVGGAHVSQFPEEILSNCPEIDFVVIGEGEEQALACAYFAKNKRPFPGFPEGIAFRSASGTSNTILPKKRFIHDVDHLPWPAYDMVNFNDYCHDTRTWHNPYGIDLSLRVPLITSRGCPNVCNFCSVSGCMGLKHRAMSSGNVADMIQMLNEKYGAKYFAVFDANFAEDASRVIDICNEINRRQLNITLDLPTGLPMSVTAPAMIDSLAGAGLIRTCISIETGDEYIRNKVMLKHVEQDAIIRVVESIRRHPQIFLLADFVIGMPEDTAESLEVSYNLIERLDVDDIALSIATPYPGTKLFDQCMKDGLFSLDLSIDHLYNAEWYSHANINRFYIKPYDLDYQTLSEFRDRILSLRKIKSASYNRRMKSLFTTP
jgi:anaerobic magnesium-protoporphyrin IX monomethyl ester cyclase